jgi:hypothetical protein
MNIDLFPFSAGFFLGVYLTPGDPAVVGVFGWAAAAVAALVRATNDSVLHTLLGIGCAVDGAGGMSSYRRGLEGSPASSWVRGHRCCIARLESYLTVCPVPEQGLVMCYRTSTPPVTPSSPSDPVN